MRKLLFAASLLCCMGFGHGGGVPCSDSMATGALVDAVVASGPNFYWGLHDLTDLGGAAFADLSGNLHRGNYVGSPTLGTVGLTNNSGCCTTPGTSMTPASGKYAGDSYDTWQHSPTFTLMAWVKINGTSVADRIICGSTDQALSGGYAMVLFANQTSLRPVVVTAAGLNIQSGGATSITDNARHMLMVRYDGSHIITSIDGALNQDSAVANAGNVLNPPGNVYFKVGAYGDADVAPMDSPISDVAYWGYTITGAAEAAIWSAGK